MPRSDGKARNLFSEKVKDCGDENAESVKRDDSNCIDCINIRSLYAIQYYYEKEEVSYTTIIWTREEERYHRFAPFQIYTIKLTSHCTTTTNSIYRWHIVYFAYYRAHMLTILSKAITSETSPPTRPFLQPYYIHTALEFPNVWIMKWLFIHVRIILARNWVNCINIYT